jgi:hypothetical protein
MPAFVVLNTPVSVARYQILSLLGSIAIAFPTTLGIAILIKTEVMSPQLQNSTDVEVLTNS